MLPHFQRQYSWERRNWQTLLEDAFAIYQEYEQGQEPEHFLGSLVVINDGIRDGIIPAFNLVDGQQRLTTISLLLCAFHDLIRDEEPITARATRKFLFNLDTEGDIQFKVLPTNKYGDRAAYQAILTGRNPGATESSIPAAYNFLRQELSRKLADGQIVSKTFFEVLANCFQVVFIELGKEESPYKIFESLNAKGKPLSQADLVRNYIAMRLPSGKQEKVFTDYWAKIEALLQERRTVGRSRIGELTAFIRHYLAIESRILCSEEHIYARFRDRCERLSDDAFVEEIARLCRFAEYYNKLLRPEHEPDLEIRGGLLRLNILEVQPSYPLLLAAYDARESWLKQKDFKTLLEVLENYVVRRYLCGEPSNYLSKAFLPLWRDAVELMDAGLGIEMGGAGVNFGDALTRSIITRNYPPDRQVQQAVRTVKLYDQRNQNKVGLVLETINRHLSQDAGAYTVLIGKATIEHILPQTLSSEWKAELGEHAEQIYQDYLHTLGNLTLLSSEWNATLSNSSFSSKKLLLAGHGLRLNQGYFSQDIPRWDETAIIQRADSIASEVLEIWASLGEPPAVPEKNYGQPNAIVIRGERVEIPNKTWRQVRACVLEWVVKNYPQDFARLRRTINIFDDSIEGKNYPRSWHQLSNGVWAYCNGSARQQMNYCHRILATVGIQESEWQLEEA